MRSVIVIDDCGIQLDLDDPALRSRLGTSRRRQSLLDVLVLNLGYVACEAAQRSVRLRLRPAVVSRRALGEAGRLLLTRAVDRVLLSCHEGTWGHELLPSAKLALRRLNDLMVRSHRQRVATFRHHDIEAQRVPSRSPVAAVLAYWQSERLHFDAGRLAPLLYRGFDQRFLIAEHLPDNDQLVIRALGDGYSIFDKKWCRLAVGERLEDQYDVYYARWAAQGYRTASERAMPLIQRVDAVIDKPRGGYRRQRYARIIVPYQQGGRQLLLSASTTNLSMVTGD
jgi:hypothetical protein